MKILPFIRPTQAHSAVTAPWSVEELAELRRLVRLLSRQCGARTWHSATTEEGDPQFYVLGARPEQRCVASISRLRGLYILEDGQGCVVAERTYLAELVRDAVPLFRSHRRYSFTVQALLAMCAARWFMTEKLAAIEDSFEVLAVLV
jgi:hypothetical protein